MAAYSPQWTSLIAQFVLLQANKSYTAEQRETMTGFLHSLRSLKEVGSVTVGVPLHIKPWTLLFAISTSFIDTTKFTYHTAERARVYVTKTMWLDNCYSASTNSWFMSTRRTCVIERCLSALLCFVEQVRSMLGYALPLYYALLVSGLTASHAEVLYTNQCLRRQLNEEVRNLKQLPVTTDLNRVQRKK